MSGDCCSNSDNTEKIEKNTCPKCGERGKAVQRLTVGSLLKPDARKKIPQGESFHFCSSPNCDLVYFSEEKEYFYLDDLTIRVGQKAEEAPKPVCYCFGYTEQMIMDDVMKNGGKTDIPTEITKQVKVGNCFCEVTNPQGSCCLGNVSQAVKKGISLYQTKS